MELQQLNAAHLNRLYAELLQSGRVRTEGGLSPTSVRRIHAMLRKALKDAIRWGLAERNAAELADPPSTKVIQAARRRSMRTWSEEDLRRFLAHTREHELGPVWLFAASTGVRRSELLGVRWSDIDLRAVIVTIRQTVLNSEDGHRPEEDQKTVASARTIHLDRRTVAMLRAHRAVQAKTRLAAGAGWEDNDLVFTRLNGGWWNPDSISSAFRRAVKAAGVPVIRLHDVRHTHASLLLKAGVNPKVVSERLGHSSVAFTLDTYAHVMPGMQPEAAEMFMRLGARPDRRGRGHARSRGGRVMVARDQSVTKSPEEPTATNRRSGALTCGFSWSGRRESNPHHQLGSRFDGVPGHARRWSRIPPDQWLR